MFSRIGLAKLNGELEQVVMSVCWQFHLKSSERALHILNPPSKLCGSAGLPASKFVSGYGLVDLPQQIAPQVYIEAATIPR
jgi:hypothetical protein